MTNNIEQIKKLLTFESEDDFYFLQIIKRKKEHPELGSNSYIVKTYFISSIENLEKHMGEIICLCDFHNARAGINLNKRSFRRIAFHNLKKITDQILNEEYRSVRKSYNSVCGGYSNETSKKWIIDIDDKQFDHTIISDILKTIQPIDVEDKIITKLETKNGYHLITSPFNVGEFRQNCDLLIDIHKDNPTILYIP